jgi:hypothetical protein
VSRQSSDFRQGVEAAAKWLATQFVAKSFIERMLADVADDPEGTELRTVAQIVRFIRETSFGQSYTVNADMNQLAESIAAGDWKRQ